MEIKGLTKDNIIRISNHKKEQDWVKDYRLESYEYFTKMNKTLPFGPSFKLDYNDIIYYKSNMDELTNDWSKVLKPIKSELEEIGVLESEQYMDGMGVQYESEVIYHSMIEELTSKNVIFTSIDNAIKNYPDLVKKYFGKIVKNTDNLYTALNSSVFSGGSFIYIPKNTKLNRPLQSYFRINSKGMGQFERTLIIVDDNSSLHYIEGCTAKTYTTSSLHAAVVEIYVGKNSSCRYTTIQNWANNVYNLVTKRALVEENATMEWIDGNIGSALTMKYPACILKGDNSKGTCITISAASTNQNQDTGARMIHLGKNTKSKIISKSIAKNNGISTYRGDVKIKEEATNSYSMIKCDTLLLDKDSISDTIPKNLNANNKSTIEHEATISKINEETLFYLETKGISKEKCEELIILGFLEEFRKELPMEYAVELNQLLKKNL